MIASRFSMRTCRPLLAFVTPSACARSALLALVLAFAPPWARAEDARIVILHTADLHGALTSWDYLADRPAIRGLTRVATLVDSIRAEGPPVMLLDAGDCIQGGIEYGRPGGSQVRPGPHPPG